MCISMPLLCIKEKTVSYCVNLFFFKVSVFKSLLKFLAASADPKTLFSLIGIFQCCQEPSFLKLDIQCKFNMFKLNLIKAVLVSLMIHILCQNHCLKLGCWTEGNVLAQNKNFETITKMSKWYTSFYYVMQASFRLWLEYPNHNCVDYIRYSTPASLTATSLIFSTLASEIPLMLHNLFLVHIWMPCK